jgi:hypothetical protein
MVAGIIQILKLDATTADQITKWHLARAQSKEEDAAETLRFAFVDVADAHATSPELEQKIVEVNILGKSMKNLDGQYTWPVVQHKPNSSAGASAATAIDQKGLAQLAAIISQIKLYTARHHQLTERYNAYNVMIDRYVQTLTETVNAYRTLDRALQGGVANARTISDFIQTVSEFRRAYLAYVEVR